uniref:Uncharacterized protein n=1 Tax=viral metagenome TaxID=1070528 RepID=A0A6C0CZI2_9ZZZZ
MNPINPTKQKNEKNKTKINNNINISSIANEGVSGSSNSFKSSLFSKGKGVMKSECSKNLWDILAIHNNILHLSRAATTINSANSANSLNMVKEDEEEDHHHFSFYLIKALPIMDKYKTMIKDRGKINFMGSRRPPPTNCEDLQTLVIDYMNLVQRYFPQWYDDLLSRGAATSNPKSSSSSSSKNSLKLESSTATEIDPSIRLSFSGDSINTSNTMLSTKGGSKCAHCEEENALFIMTDGLMTCENCGVTSEFSKASVICYKDIDRVNITSKYQYDRITHFKDCINQFQGKQNSTIDKKVYDDLIFQFRQHDLIPEDWKDLPKDEAFQKITKEHILLFLKETNHTKHYEDIVLIHSNLSGIVPPDLSSIENKLLQDFDALTNLYDRKYRNLERKNFINTQYVLFQLLRRHRFPCKKEDFNILKTIDRKYYHDDITRSLFEELGYNFTATF